MVSDGYLEELLMPVPRNVDAEQQGRVDARAKHFGLEKAKGGQTNNLQVLWSKSLVRRQGAGSTIYPFLTRVRTVLGIYLWL